MKLRRLASFVAASAVIIGLLGQGATAVLGYDHVEPWTGQGTTDGKLNDSRCTESNGQAYLLWVFTPGGGGNTVTAVDLIVGGSGSGGPYAFNQDNGQWKAQTPFFDLDTLTAEADYWGDPGNGEVNLVISHGCEGDTTTTTTTSGSSSTTTSGSSSTTTTTESSSSSTTTTESSSSSTTTTTTTTVPVTTTTTTSFSQSQQAATDVPTEPNTAAIETGGPSNPSSSVWMLIVALGLLLGSVVILTPAPSKTKR